jgi:hypothetical protein
MSCTNYVHNDPIGGSKYISGTTCTGTVAYYTLTLGQQICMDNSLPLVNLNGLVISGDCTGVTPTPTPTPIDYCYLSGFTYQSAIFQCPNDGLDYFDTYGVWTFSAYTGSQFTNDHPELNFTLTNGTDYAVVTIESNQYFTEFIYPKINFRYTDTGCISTTYPDWYIASPAVTKCNLTPTPTVTPTQTKTPTVTPTISLTPTNTQTPTITKTLTPTPSLTPNPICPQELTVSGVSVDNLFNQTYNFYGFGYYSASTFFNGIAPDGNTYIVYSGSNNKQVVIQAGATYTWIGITNFGIGPGTSTSLGSPRLSITDGTYYYPQSGPAPFTTAYLFYPLICPTATPTPTVTSTPAQTTTISLTPTQTITPTISLTPTNTLTPTISLTPTNTLTPTISLTPTNTLTPTITPTRTPTPTRTQTPTITPTKTITPSITKTPTQTPNLGLYWNVNEYDCDCNLLRSNIVLRTNQTLYPSSTNFVSFNNYPNYIFKILSSITWPGYHDVEVLNFTTVYTNANCNLIPC